MPARRAEAAFLADLELAPTPPTRPLPADPRPDGHDRARMGRLVAGMVAYTQALAPDLRAAPRRLLGEGRPQVRRGLGGVDRALPDRSSTRS